MLRHFQRSSTVRGVGAVGRLSAWRIFQPGLFVNVLKIPPKKLHPVIQYGTWVPVGARLVANCYTLTVTFYLYLCVSPFQVGGSNFMHRQCICNVGLLHFHACTCCSSVTTRCRVHCGVAEVCTLLITLQLGCISCAARRKIPASLERYSPLFRNF